MEHGETFLWGIVILTECFCVSFAGPPWIHYLWAGWGRRNSVHAKWYDREIKPQIEADMDIGEIAHLALRAKLIKRRREMAEAPPAHVARSMDETLAKWQCANLGSRKRSPAHVGVG